MSVSCIHFLHWVHFDDETIFLIFLPQFGANNLITIDIPEIHFITTAMFISPSSEMKRKCITKIVEGEEMLACGPQESLQASKEKYRRENTTGKAYTE